MTPLLSDVLQPWIKQTLIPSIPVNQLQLDSRKVTGGDVFIAIKGHSVDGRLYIDNAIEAGAVAVVADADDAHPHQFIEMRGDVPVIYLSKIGDQLSYLASRMHPDLSMRLIGITGTNGKTTISQLIAQWIELMGKSAVVMGTTGNGFLHDLQPAVNTTGSAIEILQTLDHLQHQGAEFAALEISSHGLVQGRVKSLSFDVAAFTNLSRDHLDYHGSMEEYAEAKFSLFSQHECQHKIINADDEIGQQWLQRLPDAVAVSLSEPKASLVNPALWATKVDYSDNGMTLSIDGYWGKACLKAPLIGAFNASNLLVALATLLSLGFKLEKLVQVAEKLSPVIGRMELFQSSESKAKVVVDYAHTPDALEKALMALRVHCQGQLWSIFGCGGDRDTGKRPMMTQISQRLADRTIITDDNPRSEDPQKIVAEMLEGALEPDQIQVIHSRFDACQYALKHAKPGDIILLAGKGHEDYQIIDSQTLHYSDRETAQTLLGLPL